MDGVFKFANGSVIKLSELERITKDFFELLKKELPKEALTYECINFVIDSIKDDLKTKNIIL